MENRNGDRKVEMRGRLKWTSHNWLVHQIILNHLSKIIPRYSKGRLLDIGCSDKPYEPSTKFIVDEYVSLEHADSQYSLSKADIITDSYNTTIERHSFDTILPTSVLEHLECPHKAIKEMYRILRNQEDKLF